MVDDFTTIVVSSASVDDSMSKSFHFGSFDFVD